MKAFFKFFWAAVKNPLQVSTVFATGPTASNTLTDAIPAGAGGAVVELGVGTGAITQTLLGKISAPERYIGLELNTELLEFVKERFPQLRFENDSAENFPKYLDGQPVSAVVSSLPWTLMPNQAVTGTLDAIHKTLTENGVFATYMTLHVLATPAGRRFQEQLKERFSRLESKIVIENLPPAKIFIARK
jgi:phospholipid N-methyltransferase